MWREFVEAFGWRFQGVEGYQSAQMWVEEMKTWVLFHQQEAQQRLRLTAIAACGLGVLIGLGIGWFWFSA